jgi:serine/threonine-protein kinase RsbW
MPARRNPARLADRPAAGRRGPLRAAGARFETEIIATPEAIRAVLCATRARLAAGGAAPALLSRAEIALAEVLNNVAEHAYAGCPPGRVRLCACLDANRLKLVIRDAGRPMPRDAPPGARLPATTGPAQALPEGGFGWFLIHDQCDRVLYRRDAGENRLELHIFGRAQGGGQDS